MTQRDDLLRGAKQCLTEKGYSHTTARDIAAASGSHLASIGYHFGSKDKLMRAAVLEASGEWGDAIEAAARSAGGEAPPQRLAALIGGLMAAIPEARPVHLASLQALAEAAFDEELRLALAAGFHEGRRALAAITLDRPTDEVDPAAERGIGSVMYALAVGYIAQFLIDPESLPNAEEVIAALRTLETTPPAPASTEE
ncbi:TetR/AcrR family transcriptional regulator [Streptomyces profundus]|uniref:TetR/AcrR family transcriptional regulator n=1 Tax=Streptomyces profundus TaxID=2867410 RepID=UPI001D1608D6|nr:TetR/AcrR family transcriptional regulator [Streptomyces sp. MA3_2.13]UED83373.1 TetR/AcrR family transcriptional regulator [Streptomyces sp. MA3_2.13]